MPELSYRPVGVTYGELADQELEEERAALAIPR
jgi:hypothetical protein